MNYITPHLYFNQGNNELCFQTSIPNHTSTISQDMLSEQPPMLFNNSTRELDHPVVEHKWTASVAAAAPAGSKDAGESTSRCSKKKKINHRDIERQRRQEMSMLYMSLRSLLPVDVLKGKRSISDHMSEAANYIKHLQKKFQELKDKRDHLMMRRVEILPSSNSSRSPHCEGISSSSISHVSVRTTFAGAAVVITGKLGHEVSLSQVITALVEEGLNVISVSTCYINMQMQWVYSLECESDDPRGVDSSGLQQKLTDSICLSN